MTPAERLRKHQRALDRTQRELDRERVKLENQEKKLVQDIKKSAKNGQVGACKIQAKDLVRTRRLVPHCPRIVVVWANLVVNTDISRNSIRCARSYRLYLCAFKYAQPVLRCPSQAANALTFVTLQTVRSNEQMMQSMKGATMLLGSMNRQMNLPALQRIAMEFERENDVMDQRQEMMDDAIDEATGMEGEDEEGEDIVKEVLDEIGVDLNQAVCLLRCLRMCTPETDLSQSSVKHLQTYRKHQLTKHGLLKQLGVEAIQVMMISRPDWTAFDDNHHLISVTGRNLLIRLYPVLLFLAYPRRYSYRYQFITPQRAQVPTSGFPPCLSSFSRPEVLLNYPS